jgi:hypothetical protein
MNSATHMSEFDKDLNAVHRLRHRGMIGPETALKLQAKVEKAIEASYAGYGWVIDKDHISQDLGIVDFKPRNDTNLMGPRNISPEARIALKDGEGEKFRMLDDDGEVYYEGRIVGGDYMGFEPLDDFGMPNAGCTEIQYQSDPEINHTGKRWETL